MPQPTSDAQYFKITKDFEVRQNEWANEDSSAEVNHLMSVIGDARNALLVSEMGA